ncbi:MAG: methyltransferase domain-containing protein [Planctomycetes bacterium]|nr:methyltransferase domain-containing protein [Planctomycetota bacterium]
MNPLAQELLDLGWKPKRQFGQNFLFDAHFLELMVREADLRADDVVVEFGTGPGQLTERLAQQAAFVLTIDIDPQLHAFAKARLTLPNIEFLQADAIPGGDTLSPELVQRVKARLDGRRLRVVSNFPYAVGGSILLALAEGQLPAHDALGTLQDEVADRLIAGAAQEAYGPLGILIGRLATTKKIREVPPQLFWPMPQVYSALVRVEFGAKAFEGNWPGYKAFVKSVFSQRRKMMSSGLKRLGFRYEGEHAMKRPEALTPEELETVWRESKPLSG